MIPEGTLEISRPSGAVTFNGLRMPWFIQFGNRKAEEIVGIIGENPPAEPVQRIEADCGVLVGLVCFLFCSECLEVGEGQAGRRVRHEEVTNALEEGIRKAERGEELVLWMRSEGYLDFQPIHELN
ncbi:MAG: hypothetical protein K2X38_13265 [Gemmataceae bacterium]|nr:hypothetical protein [Gemmataceae bacterium]